MTFLKRKTIKIAAIVLIGLTGLFLSWQKLLLNSGGEQVAILYSAIITFFYLVLAFYLIFKYITPDLWETERIQNINNLILCLLTGVGATFWFVYNPENIQKIILRLNELFGNLSLPFFPLIPQKWYYRPLAQIGITLGVGVLCFILSRLILRFGAKRYSSVKKINSGLYYLAIFLYLTGILGTGFQTEPLTVRSTWFFGGTEEMITDRLKNPISFREDITRYAGFNYYQKDNEPDGIFVYQSSTGFYGSLLKLFQSTLQLNAEKMIPVLRFIYAFLFALVLMFLVHKTRQLFGALSGVFLAVSVSLIFWIVGPAKLLMWVFFVFYLPYVVPWIIYPNVLDGKLSFRKFCLLVFFLEFAVILRGYEYLVNFILAPTIAVVFYSLVKKQPFTEIMKRIVVLGLCGVAAFVLVASLHLIQISFYEGSFSGALNYYLSRLVYRLNGDFTLGSNTMGSYSYLDAVGIWMTKVGLFVPVVGGFMKINLFGTTWDLNNFSLLHGLYFLQLFLLGCLALSPFRKENPYLFRKLFALTLACLLALFASWTWFVVKNHMAGHRHMNGIMYMMPFGLTFLMLGGGFLEQSLKVIFSPVKKRVMET